MIDATTAKALQGCSPALPINKKKEELDPVKLLNMISTYILSMQPTEDYTAERIDNRIVIYTEGTNYKLTLTTDEDDAPWLTEDEPEPAETPISKQEQKQKDNQYFISVLASHGAPMSLIKKVNGYLHTPPRQLDLFN